MPQHDEATECLLAAIKETLSPHAVALIAAKLQPSYAKGELGQQAERESAWLADQLVSLIGQREFNDLCEELGL
ncbi:MAG: hypothetical protein WD534_13025 [Phycisphaeraceae bacterium]